MSAVQQLLLPKNPFGVTTPLRYPGGKSAISGFLSELIESSNIAIDTYVEPYAGGAGAAISLLLNGKVEQVVINDLDPAVYCFWLALKSNPDRFIEKIKRTHVDVEEWLVQRSIYRKHDMRKKFDLGFAFFYLNRCNRSGIVKGGVIGGLEQKGTYKLNARYKTEALVEKIERIKPYVDSIEVLKQDGITVFEKYKNDEHSLIYLDPPYVGQGKSLYLNSFEVDDHKALALSVSKSDNANWIVTYDVSDLISSDDCYGGNHIYCYALSYSAQDKRKENEYLICSDNLNGLVSGYVVGQ